MKYAIFTFLLFLALIFHVQFASAQELSGIIVDEQNETLAGAEIYIPALSKGTATDASGHFRLQNLPEGIYTVRFSFLGYKVEIKRLDFSEPVTSLKIKLEPTLLNLQDIIVTSSPQPTDALSSSQSVVSLNKAELQENRGSALFQSLDKSPGLSTYTTGNGVAKPVIRGLSSQRVLVVVDGVRQESQQWGDEHAPQIDSYDVKRVEVVKGPASVLYGSDAIGGVINVIKPDLPTSETSPSLAGDLNMSGYANNNLRAGALSLHGASGPIGYRGEFTRRISGNVHTPNRKLSNTGLEETNGNLEIGTRKEWGQFSVNYARVDQRYEIFEDPAEEPDATPFQTIINNKLQSNFDLHLGGYRLESKVAYQNNNRKEFEESGAHDPALNLILNTGTADIKLHHKPLGNVFGTLGVSAMAQRNKTIAEEKLIPRYVLYNAGAFIYEQASAGSFDFSGGLRYDTRYLNVGTTPELGVEAQQRTYQSISGNIGAVWHLAEPLAFSVNVGRAFRAPKAFELYVDGVHEGTARFEVGDDNLNSETSLNLDASLRYITGVVQSELSIYNNAIDNYIFPDPTQDIDQESGFRKFQYRQADARIYGFEYSLQAQARRWLILKGGYSMVRGNNKELDNPLPLIPANKLTLNARFVSSKIGTFLNPFLSVGTSFYADQNRVADFETSTEGYTLVDISIGSAFKVGSQKMNVILQADNLFDTAYRSHLSRYKEYALNQGRNVKLKIEIPFTL